MDIVIVDDEPLARERLRHMIEALPDHVVLAEIGETDDVLDRLVELQPDAVLLDVNMPGTDGLVIARALSRSSLPPAVIFVTAHSEYALSAHDTVCTGYLLKPVRRDDLADTLERARRPSRAQYAALADHVDIGTASGYVSARTRDGIERVAIRDILYFWADHKYTSVFHRDGELLIEQSLATLEQSLAETFVRVHRKALVARAHVIALKYNDDGSAVVMLADHDCPVPVSRRRLPQIRALLADEPTLDEPST